MCLGLLLGCGIAAKAGDAREPARISVDPRQAGAVIPEDFAGLSFEIAQLLPDKDGGHYFDANRAALIQLFKTLGVRHMRVGGNSVDSPQSAVPIETDIRPFFEFAKAAGVKVIYSVRLQEGNPPSAAGIAAFIHKNFADVLDCFAIGNEPGYYKDPAVYRSRWMAIREAIANVAPGAKFCGPDDNPKPALCANVVRDFSAAGLSLLTMHSYPAGCAYQNPSLSTPVNQLLPNDPVQAREKLLSASLTSDYEKARKAAADATAGSSLSFRLDETNSYWYGGLQGASDAYAAALWSIDYLYWWAAHGASGLNFHTGERVGGGEHTVPCRYAAFLASGLGYDAKPLAYGLKMFDLGAKGKLLPVASPAMASDLSVYATLENGHSVAVTLINKAHGADARDTAVELAVETPFGIASANVIYLTALGGDIAATNGLTIGGAPILYNGDWQGQWKPLDAVAGGNIRVHLPRASVAIVKVHLNG
jgi:hypothetical protein